MAKVVKRPRTHSIPTTCAKTQILMGKKSYQREEIINHKLPGFVMHQSSTRLFCQNFFLYFELDVKDISLHKYSGYRIYLSIFQCF